jgi:hypothetical protein
LAARRLDAGSEKLLRALKVGFVSPALAPAPVPSGAEIDREDQFPAARRFRDHHVDLDLIAAFALPEGSTKSSAPGRQSGLSDFAPS